MILAFAALIAADPVCPLYSTPQRGQDTTARLRDEAYQNYALQARHLGVDVRPLHASTVHIDRRNLIDDHIFSKMQADGVPSAQPASDSEFLRRVYLDLTGRIPTVSQAEAFLSDEDPGKRDALIDSLMESDEYVDRWTHFYGNLFEVTSRYYNIISVQGRNRFHAYLQDFVRRDRSWAEVATELLTATGDSHENGPVNFMIRGVAQNEPIQDTFDQLTDRSTVRFLGMKTECISCHDGRRHLEEINLFLVTKSRADFWRMSAFFARTDITRRPLDAFGQQWGQWVSDRSSGGYSSHVPPRDPGMRPPRHGGPYEPSFLLTGQKPKSGQWRMEFARQVTSNRQFARAAVNYLWAALFSVGIVDPPDSWDLRRIDPANPPPSPWTLQPSHPALIEALADAFIASGYRIKPLIRLMVKSSAYQLASEHPGPWRPEYDRYFARHIARRLSPEEAYDAMARATMTEVPMYVEGWDQPVEHAVQLPDPTEPRRDSVTTWFLTNLGRGDWWNGPANLRSSVVQVLFLMNDYSVSFRTFAGRDGGRTTRVNYILSQKMTPEEAVRHLFLATLGRYPTDVELAIVSRNRRGTMDNWLSDLQWVLLNKMDFLFTH